MQKYGLNEKRIELVYDLLNLATFIEQLIRGTSLFDVEYLRNGA